MSDIDNLIKLISDILQPDNHDLRKNAENTLALLRKEKPNELIGAFILILDSDAKTEYRNFSASQLRLNLSQFSSSNYINLWAMLTNELKQVLKVKMFEVIYKENDLSMKKHIASTLGQLAGSIISQNPSDWPYFKTHIWALFKDPNLNANLAAFNILEQFFGFAPEYFKDDVNELYSLFKHALIHQDSKLKLSALRAFSSYLQVLQIKKQLVFQDLIIHVFEAVQYLLNKDNDEEGLQVLSEMLDIEPKFFKKKFKQLNDLLRKIFNMPKVQGGIKRMATQILVDYVQKSPGLFRKKKDILQSGIQMVFFHMISIKDTITPQWLSPPQGYNEQMEDQQDFETTRFGMAAIDRLIYAVGEAEIMPILSGVIQKLLVNPDWRYKYTAVMALSQIGQYIEQPDKIESVIQMIIGFLRDPNPMIRYSACHAIGQISDDMQPGFQQKYGAQIYPELVNLLSDPVPRIVAHSEAALTNFLEGMKAKDIEYQLDHMMDMLIKWAIVGISLVKESALSAISSVVQITKQKFEKYLAKTVQVLFSYFSDEKYCSKQYKQLKGQSIETLTIIASSVGGEMFKFAAGQLIEMMITLQSSQFEQIDPQKSYILAGWQRLCVTYGKELGGSLDRILPSLFILVENVIKNELNLVNNPDSQQQEKKDVDDDNDNINTYETQQAQIAISMLNVFIQQLKELYTPYVEKTVNLLCNIIKEHPNEDVKEEACKCLPNLIKVVKITNNAVAVAMAKLFMQTLVETIETEFESEIIIVQLQTLKNVLEQLDLCFLTEGQVTKFSEKILSVLKKSDQKKQSNKQFFSSQDVDDDQKQLIGQQIKQQQQVQVAISQLIGILFKTHKLMTLNLANFIITTILPSVFVNNQSQNMLKFGIFLIDDMIEFLGYELMQVQWFNFGNALMKYTNDKSCVLRQAACYGLGILAVNTPNNALNSEYCLTWLQSLVEAIKIPKGSQKQKTYGHCRDNIIASIGKIIKCHSNLFDPIPYVIIWLACLPLKYDKEQGIVQHELLADIMLVKPEIILGSNKLENTKRVLTVYAEIVGNPSLYNSTAAQKIKSSILQMHNDPFFNEHSALLWDALPDKCKQSISTFMK